jgi:predicted MPP superfamily phosphohydrolase
MTEGFLGPHSLLQRRKDFRMYLMSELVLFSPLIIYACVRIRKLIPGTILKNLFVLFYILLFFGYPIAELLSHRDATGWFRWAMIAGYYCLPYLLYIILSVAAIDIGILILRILNILRADTVSGAVFRYVRLSGCLILPALIVFAGAWNNNRLAVKEYSIKLPRRSSTENELKIVFASDFHLSRITGSRLVERFVSKVNALHPDIVLIGGDVLEGHGIENLNEFETQFSGIIARYGVYAAPGNHERYGGGRENFYTRSGMKYLEDRVEKIGDAFYIAGRKTRRGSQRKPIDELLKDAPEDLPIILIDHSPTDLENVSRSRVDLQLSGHTHNGQLFPVNLLVMPFRYELAWGMKSKGNSIFIVSCGLQAWGPPVKTAGTSEILLIKAVFQ